MLSVTAGGPSPSPWVGVGLFVSPTSAPIRLVVCLVLFIGGAVGFLVLAYVAKRFNFRARVKQTQEGLTQVLGQRPADSPRFPRYPRGGTWKLR